jgi:hypothetical protein
MGFSLAHRASISVAATTLFLYVLNHRHNELPGAPRREASLAAPLAEAARE